MVNKKYFTILIILLFTFLFSFRSTVYAQQELDRTEEVLEGEVTRVVEEKEIVPFGSDQPQVYQKLEIAITNGSLEGETIVIENGSMPIANLQNYKVHDELVINYTKDIEGNDMFYISDYVRRSSLFWLFALFVLCTVVIAGWRGVMSIAGMALSFAVIFLFILPNILAGANPVFIAIAGSLLIIPVTFFLSHGLNKKTLVAIAGTCIALVITGVLAGIFVEAAKLTGFASEEAGFLQIARQGTVNIRGLLLAGIIIGVLGVLDDITISQSAIVFQLKEANKALGFDELFKRAMNIGQDHISSMVNTLILVYTGAALPLLLLFVGNPHPFSEIINYEIIADEVVRTLVGSIGLILAVPITTILASLVVAHEKK
jgi:uncharacterized membrane protein